jgi:ACS family tartrate transporter-like MFS transporter
MRAPVDAVDAVDLDAADAAAVVDPQALNRKLMLRLVLPFLVLIVINSLDRVNVGFAALRMNAALGMSPETYGFGVGLFFVGYMAAQVPSMWLLQRLGMRRWMVLVIVSWGLVATATAFVQDAQMFFALRFLLGVAEAGFAPGVTYCCTLWIPRQFRGGAISKTMTAIPLSVILGGPLSGWLMDAVPVGGIEGWRWMIFIEGLPAIALGLAAWWFFVDKPADAHWLTAAEKHWLARQLAPGAETQKSAADGFMQSLKGVLGSGVFWLGAAVWFGLLVGAYGLIYWLPLVIKQATQHGQLAGLSNLAIGTLSALPWVGVAAGMVLNARHSDATQERHLHVALPALLAAAGLAAAAWAGSGWLAMMCLVVGGFGLGAAQGTFWTLPTSHFAGGLLPLAIALTNMTGNLGGLLGPVMVGALKQRTGQFTAPVFAIASIIALAGIALLVARWRTGRRSASQNRLL